MPLGLDLTASRAKFERAMEHFQTLQTEMTAAPESSPYSLRGEFDDERLRYCVYLEQHPVTWRPRFAVLAGDVYHNLRCALDYIVTELVAKSGEELTTRHLFPIFPSESKYKRAVGWPEPRDSGGPLKGAKYGFREIEELQPYNTNPGAPEESFLWHLHCLSNADKHRTISLTYPKFLGGRINVIAVDAHIVEEWEPTENYTWEEGREYKMLCVRFKRPPTDAALDYELRAELGFVVSARAEGEEKRLGHNIPFFEQMCRQVETIVNLFENL
jgi:hypothetical protein